MNYPSICVVLALCGSIGFSTSAVASLAPIGAAVRVAEIDESAITRTIWVNQSALTADDVAGGERGSEAMPYRSITAASEAMRAALMAGEGVRLRIAPGIYREDLSGFVDMRKMSPAAATPPLVIEGTEAEGVIISGAAERLGAVDFRAETWRPVPGHDGVFEHDWPFAWGVNAGPWSDSFGIRFEGLAQRRELIVVDGIRLRQVDAEIYRWDDPDGPAYKKTLADPLAPRPPANQPGKLVFAGVKAEGLAVLDAPGTFCVFDNPKSPEALRGKIFVRLAPGKIMEAGRSVEVAMIASKGRSLLRLGRKDNVVLRNLTLRHANPGFVFPALLAQGKNILIENVRTVDNDGRGMQLEGERITVRNTVAQDNGQKGIGFTGNHFVFEDVDASFNNQRGVLGGFLGWDSAGIKAAMVNHVIMRRVTAVGNRTGGVWFDVACSDLLVEHCFFYGNERPGLEFEFSSADLGGQEVRDSVMAENQTCGLFITDVRDTRVVRNLIVGNKAGLLELEPSAVQIAFKNFHPRGPDTAAQWERVMLVDNTIESWDDSALIGFQNKKTDAAGWSMVLSILEARGNRYSAPTSAQEVGFEKGDGSFGDFTAWRAMLDEAAPSRAEKSEVGSTFSVIAKTAEEKRAAFAPGSAYADKAAEIGVTVPQALLERYWREINERATGKQDRTDG